MERAAAEIRRPLAILPVTATALTEWITRTTSGWTGFSSNAMVRLLVGTDVSLRCIRWSGAQSYSGRWSATQKRDGGPPAATAGRDGACSHVLVNAAQDAPAAVTGGRARP